MTVIGPDFISLQVRDLDAAADFYEHRLGLHRAPTSPPHAVVFATEPIAFAVRAPIIDLDAIDHLGAGVALWLHADDPQGLYDSLVAAGVRIETEPFDGPFGRTFALCDLDGYVITVHG